MLLRLLVTFCFCLALGASATVKADCPASVPSPGATCPLTGNAWMTCSYDRKVCCPGTTAERTIYQKTADCRNGTWSVGVAACSCPATLPASTCPSSADALPDTCTGSVECRYGQNATCCNGAVQFNGRIYQCSNGQWRVGIADGCLFGCTGCPTSTPTNAASCFTDASLSCTYGSATTARCVQGKWAVATTPPTTCPSSAAALPATCTGSVQCKYGQNATCCNGAVQFNGRIYQCSGGSWQMAIADGCLFGCTGCPTGTTPTNGASCTTDASLSCKYGSTTAKCVQGKWAVNGGFTDFCPATAPTNGQSCSLGSSAWIHCQYNSKTCSCGGVIYQTDAWCRSPKSVWEVSAVSCPPCLVQEN